MPINSGALEPKANSPIEWMRYPEAARVFGLSRAKLYELAGNGKIKTASLRDVGQTKATRLFEANSIRSYIESCVLNTQ